MNDHDLIIKIGTQLDYVIKELQQLRDGVKKDVVDLQVKVDVLEKKDIALENLIKQAELNSTERATANGLRITALETANREGVTRSESNKAYVWRKIFEWVIPFMMLLAGIVLSKLNILNLN